jgi:hypothetical protein
LILAFAARRYLVSGRASGDQGRPASEFRLTRRADRRGFPSYAWAKSTGTSRPSRVDQGLIKSRSSILIPCRYQVFCPPPDLLPHVALIRPSAGPRIGACDRTRRSPEGSVRGSVRGWPPTG